MCGFAGDRFHQSFTGVGLSEEYGTWSDNVNAESKDDYRNKNKGLSKLKLKLVFDFPVGMEEHLGRHAKTMLNKQLHFLDRLEWLSEGKPLELKDCMEEADGDENYTSLVRWMTFTSAFKW